MSNNKKNRFSILKFQNPFSFWKNTRIGLKYLTAFIITIFLFLGGGIIVYSQLSTAEKGIEQIETESIRANEISQLGTLIQEKDSQFANYIFTDDSRHINNFESLREQFDELINKLELSTRNEEQETIISYIKRDDGRINDMFDEIIAVSDSDNFTASTTRGRSNVLRENTVNLVNDLIDIVHKDQAESVVNSKTNLNNSIYTLIIVGLIAVSIGGTFILITSRNISTNLNKVISITNEITDGNLSVESLDYEGRDEIGQLASSMNQMKNNIQNIIFKVNDASESVSSSSEELTQSANEVNEGSDQVASTMEEISTGAENQANSASDLSESMSNFIELVQSSERYGQEVATTSSDVLGFSAEGSTLMKEAIGQMNRIDLIVADTVEQVQGLDKQSEEISQLVLVIQKIADQTNLLSLNAAIEAARAGEHGLGFAVVANEVRKLAEEVGSSVSSITNIVTNIQAETSHVVESLNKGYNEVNEGTKHIEKTGENFGIIDKSITDMVTKILAISKNLKDISQSSDQMNEFIEDIAAVSEQSAAGVEEAAASSQQTASAMDEISNHAVELAKLAEQLNTEVNVFTLSDK